VATAPVARRATLRASAADDETNNPATHADNAVQAVPQKTHDTVMSGLGDAEATAGSGVRSVGDALQGAVQAGKEAYEGLVGGVGKEVDPTDDNSEGVSTDAASAPSGAAADVESAAADVKASAEDTASDVASSAKDAASDVEASAKDVASDVEASAKDAASDVEASAKDVASDVEASAKDVASDVEAAAKDAASDVEGSAKDVASDVEASAKDAASDVKASAKDVASDVEASAKDAASDAKEAASDVTDGGIVQGIKDGLKSVGKDVERFVHGSAASSTGEVVQEVKDTMMEIGTEGATLSDAAEGTVTGAQNAAAGAKKTLEVVGEDAKAGLKGE